MIINDGGRDPRGEESSLLLPPGGRVAEPSPHAPTLLPRGEGGRGRVAHRGDGGHRARRAAHQALQAARPPAIQPRIALNAGPDQRLYETG
jgi:hypothetical protein